MDKIINEDTEFDVDLNYKLLDDENVLDIKIVRAEFNETMIEAFQSSIMKGVKGNAKNFMSLVALDFFDHDNEVSSLGYGAMPVYNS